MFHANLPPMLQRFAEHTRWWHIALFIVLTCLLLYGPSLANKFVSLDDTLLITQNPAVQAFTPQTVKRAFTTYDPELYVPLTLVSYQIENALFGLRPGVFHSTNLLLHTLNALLVFAGVYLLLKRKGVAAATAILFAVHPLHTEAVLWAAARKDLLSTFFFLSSLCAYLSWRDREDYGLFLLSIVLFVLGLLSKVTVVTLPVVLLMIDWKRQRPMVQAVREKWPFWLFAVVFGIVALFGKREVLASSGVWMNFLLACKSTLFYLWHIFFPVGFTVLYPQLAPVTILSWEFALPVIALLLILALIVGCLRRLPIVSFCLAFFLLTLVPNFTNFVKAGVTYVASDRYAYIPSIGIFLLVAIAVSHLYQRRPFGSVGARALDILMACVFVGLVGIARTQAQTWRDSEALYRHALSVVPSAVAYNNLGDFLMKTDREDEAKGYFEAAISLDPSYQYAYNNLGNYERERGDYDAAMRIYRQAIGMLGAGPVRDIEYLAPYYYLGEVLELTGKTDEGLQQFQAAVQRAPARAEPYYNLGLQYEKIDRLDAAADAYKKAVQFDAGYVPAQYHLAGLLAQQGKLKEAEAALEAVVRINPGYEEAMKHLQNIRAMER